MFILYSLPFLVEDAIRGALRDDGEDPDDYLPNLAKGQASYVMNTIPFVRELSGVVEGYRYQGPAGASIFADASNLYQQLSQGEYDEGLWKALNNTGGVLFHYPSTSLQRMIDAVVVAEEDGAGAGALALAAGKPRD